MNRSIPVFFLALTAPLAAQSTSTAAVSSTSATTTSSAAPLEQSGGYAQAYATPHNSLISQQLYDSMPHYEAPKPKVVVVQAQPSVDLRDVDKPKNHINRLPAYLVHGEKPPIFAEKLPETHEGRMALGMQNFKGLNLSPILNKPIAEQMQYDQERLDNMAELQDEATDIGRGVRSDAAESDFIKQASQDTYIRTDQGYSVRGPGG